MPDSALLRVLPVVLAGLLLLACSSGKSTGAEDQRLRALEATVAALQTQVAQLAATPARRALTPNAAPSPSPTVFGTPTGAPRGLPGPSATGTPAPRGLPGPSATGTPTSQWVAVARQGTPNVRSAPSTDNSPLGTLDPGRRVEVVGKSADGDWLQIVWDNDQKAWVAQELLEITSGDPTQLPVIPNP
jgi:uncharacterized protein YgiM (DUF1202 family)